MWNVTSLGGREPELMREVEDYRLDLVGARGWTLFFSGGAKGVKRGAGVGILTSPPG